MQATTESRASLNKLDHLRRFARYLLDEKLQEASEKQIAITRELSPPFWHYLKNLSPEQLQAVSEEKMADLLKALADDSLEQYITASIKLWTGNLLPGIDKTAIKAEDIVQFSHIRKNVFLHFITGFTTVPEEIIELVREIDHFLNEFEKISINIYSKILREKIDEHSNFIEKITNTSPGIIYVYDVVNRKELYANRATSEFLGYSVPEIMAMGDRFVEEMIHPGDIDGLREYEREFDTTKDGEIRSFKYRIRNRNGEYRWLRTYETVFRRNDEGQVCEKIGIAIDVHQQKITADALQKREAELLEAQEIAHMGNYTWDLKGNTSTYSPQTAKILEVEANDLDGFMKRLHPGDKKKVEEAIEKAYSTGYFECEYRYHGNAGEKVIWTRAVVHYEEQKPVSMTGFLMDITERAKLLQRLQQNEVLYQQAEELAAIGNWNWNLETDEIIWTDQQYRNYGLEPQSQKITIHNFLLLVHPEDRDAMEKIAQQIFVTGYSDHNFRIITPQGTIKRIHTLARVYHDHEGRPTHIVGTERDITEKELLLERLQQTESMYKRSEELSNMGNWKYYIKTGRLEWTDHLYRIYGLEPQSEEITVDRFLSFVHPDDQQKVIDAKDRLLSDEKLDYTFRILVNGKIKIMRSISHIERDEKGDPAFIVGTERDATEKQSMLERLMRNEELFKQAQALAHVGNYSYDIETGEIEWSDELYRIYGLEPQSEQITADKYMEFIDPLYRDKLQEVMNEAISLKEPRMGIAKIILRDGTEKYVQSTGEMVRDANGRLKMIGTAQDVTEKQALIERLQQSEQLYKQAQEIAGLGNWIWDIETGKISWSEEIYRIYELPTTEEIDFARIQTYIHPDDREDILRELKHSIETGNIYDKHHRIILHNGKVKTIHRRAEMIRENGRTARMIGITQDVSEHHRIQHELLENQMFIRKITDATPSIITSYNVNTGKYSFVSEGMEKLLGYTTEAALERGIAFFIELIHPDDLNELITRNREAIEEANAHPHRNDMVVEFTYRMRHRNGHYRWFHTYGTIFDRNNEGLVETILNISLDVTDQKEAAQKIIEQEHFIQQIADASPTILYLYDIDTQSVQYINREIFFVLGYLPDEIIDAGSELTEMLYHPDDHQLLPGRRQSQKNFQQIDSMMQYECRLQNKDGEWRWFLVREIVFKTDEKGSIKQILGAALDINRRKEMERTILQNTLQLEQSNASLEEFAYVASHDLKEPLRKISTFGDRLMASHQDNLSPEGKIYLKKIIDASQRMQTMISDLLSISMISGNRSFERYSLQKILDETLQTLEYKIEQQNALVTWEPLPDAQIIPSQFRQLFQNLLSNSLKFVKEDVQPQVRISCETIAQSEVAHYQLSVADQYLRMVFSDNGIGFENEFAGKIFTIFQRLHGRSEYEGSGIGLAICKKIVEHHGGVIFANGEPGLGASFTIILPA